MHGYLKGLTATAVFAASVLAASDTAAQTQTQTPGGQPTTVSPIEVSANSVRVSFRDVNLDSAIGQSVMRERITRASHYVCGLTTQPLSVQMAQLGCISDAKQDAFEQLAAVRMARASAPTEMALILPIER